MKAPALGRDPFTRQTLVKRSATSSPGLGFGHRIEDGCAWCGQHGKLYRFDVEPDSGPTSYGDLPFCSKSCHDAYSF